MKRINWLKDLLDIAIWGSLLIFGVGIIVILATNDFSITKFGGGNFNDLTDLEKVLLGLLCIGYVFFFWALFKMKALTACFVKRDFFSPKTAKLSKQTGFLFILSAVITIFPTYFHQLFLEGNFKINGVEPGSFFFLIIIGIFFRTIGFLFGEARNFKEDSELTV